MSRFNVFEREKMKETAFSKSKSIFLANETNFLAVPKCHYVNVAKWA
jgi:hypothetical protein